MMRTSKQSARSSASFLSLASVLLGILTLFSACQDGSPTAETAPTFVSFSLSMPSTVATDGQEEQALIRSFDRITGLRILVERVLSGEVAVDTTYQVSGSTDGFTLEVVIKLLSDPEEFRMSMIGLQGGAELFRAEQLVTLNSQDRYGGRDLLLPLSYTGPGVRVRVEDPIGNPHEGVSVLLETENGILETSETNANGVALFIDIPAGAFTVRPVPLSGQEYCPSVHQGVLGGQESFATVAFEAGQPCDARYLILSGGDFDHNSAVVAGLQPLLPESRFESYFFLNDPPAFAMLVRYNAVLLYEDGVFGGSQILGNRVAEYLAQGGNLVVGTFYWQNRSDGPFNTRGWGALEGWDIFSSAGGATYTPGSLDPNSVVPHAVMSGVSALESTGFRGGVSGGGSGVLARWNDGIPLVGISGGENGTRVVAISFFPAGGGTGDAMTLYANAVQWAGSGGLASNASGSSQNTAGVDWKAPPPFNYRSDDPGDTPSRKLGGTHHKH